MAPQLIVALDVPSAQDAERLVDQLYELDVIVKIGLEALYGYPERIFSYCEARDVRTFVDAKLHDIPRTVGAAIAQLVRPTVRSSTFTRSGGPEMMRAAVDAADERAAELGITRAARLCRHAADEHRGRGSERAGPAGRSGRERDSARSAGARRRLRGRRLQRA